MLTNREAYTVAKEVCLLVLKNDADNPLILKELEKIYIKIKTEQFEKANQL